MEKVDFLIEIQTRLLDVLREIYSDGPMAKFAWEVIAVQNEVLFFLLTLMSRLIVLLFEPFYLLILSLPSLAACLSAAPFFFALLPHFFFVSRLWTLVRNIDELHTQELQAQWVMELQLELDLAPDPLAVTAG